MTVTVTDGRTTIDEADSTTGWSSPTASETISLNTSDPDPVEASGCLGMTVSSQTSDIVHTVPSTNLSNTLVYVWVLAHGADIDTLVNGGLAIVLGDGTDLIGYHLAGSDIAAFRYPIGPTEWQCLVLDTNTLPSDFTVHAGVEANLTLTAITRIGAHFKTLSAAKGSLDNCFIDVVRYGTQGLTVTAGTSGDPGTFLDIAEADRSTGNQRAYGIIREIGASLYGVQGSITFGDTSGTASNYFYDTDVYVQFEDRSLTPGRFGFAIKANSTGDNHFQLGDPLGAAGGKNGCVLFAPPGTGPFFTANDGDIDNFFLYDTSMYGFTGGIVLSFNATTAPDHEIFGCFFSGNGQITVGRTQFKNNRIVKAILPNTEAGAILWPPSDADCEGHAFEIGDEGHAIRFGGIVSGTSIEFRDITFEGYTNIVAGNENGAFNTETDVNSVTDEITVTLGGVTGDSFFLNDDGGSETIGLTEGTQYFGRNQGPARWSFHPTKADAEADTNTINLTASGVGNGEDQHIYPGNACVVNESGGNVEIHVQGGDVPSIRNIGAATTTVFHDVIVNFTGLITGSEVRVYEAGTNTEIDGIEATAGSTFSFTGQVDQSVDYVILGPVTGATRYVPIRVESISFAVETTIVVSQQIDRNFSNP